MDSFGEVNDYLSSGRRVIVVASHEVNLNAPQDPNDLFLLVMPEGSLAAGGRGGGMGERRVVKVMRFHIGAGSCEKLLETEDESVVQKFEVPYYVTRLPLTLRDGSETMGYGVVDKELVSGYLQQLR